MRLPLLVAVLLLLPHGSSGTAFVRGPIEQGPRPTAQAGVADTRQKLKAPATALEFIDTGFENASPLWYETAPDGAILVHLMYDHDAIPPIARRAIFISDSTPGPAQSLRSSSRISITSITAGRARSRMS